MNKLGLALLVSFIGHIIAWFHMQGQFRYEWAKSLWWVVIGGIPITGMLDQWDSVWQLLYLES